MNLKCRSCGRYFFQNTGRPAHYCEDCRYGVQHSTAHQKLREATVGDYVGTACVRCGKPMLDPDQMHLDHNDDRTGYLGYSCAKCNMSAGGRKGSLARAATVNGSAPNTKALEREALASLPRTTPKRGEHRRIERDGWRIDEIFFEDRWQPSFRYPVGVVDHHQAGVTEWWCESENTWRPGW